MCQKVQVQLEEKLDAFQQYVLNFCRENNYQLGQIGNANQMPLYFAIPATKTIERQGVKQTRLLPFGLKKTGVTAALCYIGDGHNKLPPCLIYKRKTLPKGTVFPSGVIVRANEEWMTTNLVADCIDLVWWKAPGANLGLRAVIVLGAFKCHLKKRIKGELTAGNPDLVVIPGVVTSRLQPVDVFLNEPVKDRIRALYPKGLVNGGYELAPSNGIKSASLQGSAG